MQNKRQQILQSAINMVTQYGYRRTSMDDIAKDAGISRPAIYQHFKNKEAVTLAAIELVNEQGFIAARLAAEEFDDPAQKLSAYISAYMMFFYRLVIAGPHADEIMQVKKRLGSETPEQARKKLIMEINQIIGLSEDDETGHIIASAAEGIKMAAPDQDTLKTRLVILVEKLTGSNAAQE